MKTKMMGRLALAMLTLSAATPLSAGTLYTSGFEPPVYAPGALSGQDGWFEFSSNSASVETATVFAGSQAVAYNAAVTTGQDGVFHPLSYSAAGNPDSIVEFDIAFQQSLEGTSSTWDVFVVQGSSGFLSQVLVLPDGDATLGLASSTVGSVPITLGVWNDFQYFFDFSTQTETAYVNSELIGSGAFANPSTDLTAVGFGVNSTPGTDSAFYDNLTVTSEAATPEPGSAALVLAGIGAFVAIRRRRLGCTTEPAAVLEPGDPHLARHRSDGPFELNMPIPASLMNGRRPSRSPSQATSITAHVAMQ